MPNITSEIIKAATETYNLELSLEGLNEVAVSKAIESALSLLEQGFLESIAREAELYAEECDGQEHRDSLRWFADKLRKRIPGITDETYIPQEGDVVEVVLIGPVSVYENHCENCGEQDGVTTWAVFDNNTEQEFFFEELDTKDLRIKVLDQAP